MSVGAAQSRRAVLDTHGRCRPTATGMGRDAPACDPPGRAGGRSGPSCGRAPMITTAATADPFTRIFPVGPLMRRTVRPDVRMLGHRVTERRVEQCGGHQVQTFGSDSDAGSGPGSGSSGSGSGDKATPALRTVRATPGVGSARVPPVRASLEASSRGAGQARVKVFGPKPGPRAVARCRTGVEVWIAAAARGAPGNPSVPAAWNSCRACRRRAAPRGGRRPFSPPGGTRGQRRRMGG